VLGSWFIVLGSWSVGDNFGDAQISGELSDEHIE